MNDSLGRLLEGNRRFAEGKSIFPNTDGKRRGSLLSGQKPFAAVLTCSDSRTPPEFIFDCGFGDIFVVRTAGNIVDKISLGSLEYAAAHLNVPLLVVLGHTGCGAVKAAVSGANEESGIAEIIRKITPAVERTKDMEGDAVDNAAKENVLMVAEELKSPETLTGKAAAEGKLEIIPMFYDMESGKVSVLE